MANFEMMRVRKGVWVRRIAFYCASAASSLLLITMLLAALLMASGVLEW